MNRTELSEIGEFGLIDLLASKVKILNKSTVQGIGDDAAIIDNTHALTLVSTDILVENIHFDLTYTPLKHLGYKAAVVNFSDIYAMNGIPKQITVGIAVSNRFSVEAIEELYDGILLACKNYNVDLVGGDTSSSAAGLFISVTVIGEAAPGEVIYRKGAKENDLICVTGDLGAAYTGLLVLEREKEVFKVNPSSQPDFAGNEYIIERQLKPEARKDIIELLQKEKIRPTAMIDISDGLASEILHICNLSGKGCRIYDEKLPIDQQTMSVALDFGIDPSTCALNGGEDYELLFTVDLKDFDRVSRMNDIHVIGHIAPVKDGAFLITRKNEQIPITAQGWDGFKPKKE